MRRTAAALLLAGLLGWGPVARAADAPPAGGGDATFLRVGDFRVTLEQFDRRHASILDPLAADPEKKRSARVRLVSERVQDLLLSEVARKDLAGNEGFLENLRRNSVNEYLTDTWLGHRIAKVKGVEARRKKALSIVSDLEKKADVRRRLPLLGADGTVPPDDRVVAEVGKEKIRFGRVRAFHVRTYEGVRAWPGEAKEDALREALEGVIRLELVARAARAGKGAPPGDPGGGEWVYRDRLKDLAVSRCREEAYRPDPEIEAKVEEKLPLPRAELHPVRVIAFKGEDPKDLADFIKTIRGLGTDNPSAGSRVQEVKFRRMPEYWLPKGFLPLPVELAALAVPADRQFSESVAFSGEHYVVRILERGEPPFVDREAEKKRLREMYRGMKYQRLLREAMEKAQAEAGVEVRKDLL
jgi:hypothetical protein